MSMIDCKVHVEKKPDPNGDRVVLSFECVLLASLLMCPTSRVLIVGNSCHMLDGERGTQSLKFGCRNITYYISCILKGCTATGDKAASTSKTVTLIVGL